MRRTVIVLMCSAGLGGLLLAPAAEARKHVPARKGGKVVLAWPKTSKGTAGKAPHSPLARWLARQVGPTKVTPKKRKHALTARAAVTARAAAAATPNFVAAATVKPLDLVRSFDIPQDDPAYKRLLNLSFTYDSAIAAIAFIGAGNKAQATMLLDQLAALQRKDGSLDLAYDTTNGASAQLFRTGTVAWVGLAATVYQREYGNSKYSQLTNSAADWLLAQQRPDGLLPGGPDVTWVSTQNNIIASQFLLQYRGSDAKNRQAQGQRISDAVVKQMLVGDHFVQGLGDQVVPTDVQALGALLLQQRDDTDQARQVVKAMIEGQRITDRSIELSSDPQTYNMTYQDKGPFTGFRPYANEGSPDMVWFEWTMQAKIAMDRLDFPDPQLAGSLHDWEALTLDRKQGPLGANVTVNEPRFNEFHVWPTSAAGSWMLLEQNKPDLLLPS